MSPDPSNRTTHTPNEEVYCDEAVFPDHPFVIGAKYTGSDIYKILEIPADKQGADWNNGYHREGNDYFIFCNIDTSGRTGHNYSNYWRGDTLVWSGKTNSHFEQESIKKLLSSDYRKFIFYRKANREPFTFAGVGTPSPHLRSNKPIKIDWSFISSPFKQSTAYTPNIDPRAIEMNLSDAGKRKPLSSAKEPKQGAENIFTRLFEKFLTNPPSSQIIQEAPQEANKPSAQSGHTAETPNKKTLTLEETTDFVEDLLSGHETWEPFNQKGMQDITTNLVLCYVYKNSACANLSEFLALSKTRLHLRKYWRKDELLLKKELIKYFQSVSPTLPSVTQTPQANEDTKHTAPVASSPGTTPDSESAALTDIVEEPPEASAPLIAAEKLVAPTVENEPHYISTESVEQLTQELLSGDAHVEALDHLWIGDISNDVRLTNVYEHSQSSSITEFLALGKERMKVKNYGKLSERKLKEGIETYLAHHGHEAPLFTQISRDDIGIDHDSLVMALRKRDNAEKAVSTKIWKEICRDLRNSTLANQKIAPTAAELQMKWPISPKSPLSDKYILDYLNHSCQFAVKVHQQFAD